MEFTAWGLGHDVPYIQSLHHLPSEQTFRRQKITLTGMFEGSGPVFVVWSRLSSPPSEGVDAADDLLGMI